MKIVVRESEAERIVLNREALEVLHAIKDAEITLEVAWGPVQLVVRDLPEEIIINNVITLVRNLVIQQQEKKNAHQGASAWALRSACGTSPLTASCSRG